MLQRTFYSLLLVVFCTVSVTTYAASKAEINAKSTEALSAFYKHSSAGKQLVKQAKGMLILPRSI